MRKPRSSAIKCSNNLALLLDVQGKQEKADKMHRETQGLALLLGSQGRHKEAECAHRIILKWRERVLGSAPNS